MIPKNSDPRYHWRIIDVECLPLEKHYVIQCKDLVVARERTMSQWRRGDLENDELYDAITKYGQDALTWTVLQTTPDENAAIAIKEAFSDFFQRKDKLFLSKEERALDLHTVVSTYPNLIDPMGQRHLIDEPLTQFAKRHGMVRSCLYALVTGAVESYLGWTAETRGKE